MILIQLAVILVCIFMGARMSGISLGVMGMIGLLVLLFVFGLQPADPPLEVMLIILSVVTAAAAWQAAGGMDFLVSVGIVIASVGNGNITNTALDACAKASKKGIVVVRSTRATGTVGRNVEVNDDEQGLVASFNLNPQKSRILLSVALIKPRKLDEIQKMFIEY